MRSGKCKAYEMRDYRYILFEDSEYIMKFDVKIQIFVDLIMFRYFVDIDIDDIVFSFFKQFDVVLRDAIDRRGYYCLLVNEVFREIEDTDVDLKE